MSKVKFKNICCNPFNEKHHSGKQERRNLRRVSSVLLKKLDNVSHDDVLCISCRKRSSAIPDNGPRKDLYKLK